MNGRRELVITTVIDDLGDLRTFGALRDIDASGLTVVPDAGYPEGTLVDLPDWRSKTPAPIAVGQPGRIALLRPAEGGKYRVELVIGN